MLNQYTPRIFHPLPLSFSRERGDSFFSFRFAVFVSIRMVAYPFTSIESPSARYFPFDVCLEMAAVASTVNYRVADSKRLALQPHRFSVLTLIGAHLYRLSFSRYFPARSDSRVIGSRDCVESSLEEEIGKKEENINKHRRARNLLMTASPSSTALRYFISLNTTMLPI